MTQLALPNVLNRITDQLAEARSNLQLSAARDMAAAAREAAAVLGVSQCPIAGRSPRYGRRTPHRRGKPAA